MSECNPFKNTNLTYYQKNNDVVLSKAKDYYEKHKQKLREQARNKYRNLPEEEKIKKGEYGKGRYHSMSKDHNENHKEKIIKQARNKYKNLPEEEKILKKEYGKNRYHNMIKKPKSKKIIKMSIIINNDSVVF